MSLRFYCDFAERTRATPARGYPAPPFFLSLFGRTWHAMSLRFAVTLFYSFLVRTTKKAGATGWSLRLFGCSGFVYRTARGPTPPAQACFWSLSRSSQTTTSSPLCTLLAGSCRVRREPVCVMLCTLTLCPLTRTL